MAVTKASAIKFSNEKVRPAADRLAQAYYFAQQVLDEWNGNQISNDIPNDSTVINDGAHESGANPDGRQQITGSDVHLVMSRLQELINDYEANSNAKLNTILGVAVNQTR